MDSCRQHPCRLKVSGGPVQAGSERGIQESIPDEQARRFHKQVYGRICPEPLTIHL